MSHICENYLDVYGDKREVARAVHEWTSLVLDAEETYYEPHYNPNLMFDEQFEGCLISRCGGHARFLFLSRNTPAVWFFRRLSEHFPHMRFMHRWEEGGCDLYGFAVIINGTVRGVNHEPWVNEPPPLSAIPSSVMSPEAEAFFHAMIDSEESDLPLEDLLKRAPEKERPDWRKDGF